MKQLAIFVVVFTHFTSVLLVLAQYRGQSTKQHEPSGTPKPLSKTEGPPPETPTQLSGALLYKQCLAIKQSLMQISRKNINGY